MRQHAFGQWPRSTVLQSRAAVAQGAHNATGRRFESCLCNQWPSSPTGRGGSLRSCAIGVRIPGGLPYSPPWPKWQRHRLQTPVCDGSNPSGGTNTDSLAARAASGLENRDDTERLGVRLLGYPPISAAFRRIIYRDVVGMLPPVERLERQMVHQSAASGHRRGGHTASIAKQ